MTCLSCDANSFFVVYQNYITGFSCGWHTVQSIPKLFIAFFLSALLLTSDQFVKAAELLLHFA